MKQRRRSMQYRRRPSEMRQSLKLPSRARHPLDDVTCNDVTWERHSS